MNYLEWSQEYTQTAQEMDTVVQRLKKKRSRAGESEKRELNDRISMYRSCRNECLDIARRLMERHRGAA